MSKDSIEALRKQLQQVQLGKTNKTLSERNCVELVSKLVERGLVQVLYTQDGSEYVTFERLQVEILEELRLHGGRLNLVDLVSLLGVDLPYIESALEKLKSKDKTLRLEQGVLFNAEYFASVAQEIEELLQTMNFTTITELSSRFELRIELMKEIVHKYLDTIIRGKIENNTIYNNGYVLQLEATIFGTLKAACLPVSLRRLAKKIQSRVDWVREKTEIWCKQEKLDGYLYGTGENTLFTPRLFDQKRIRLFEEQLQRNRYIDFRFLQKFYVQEPQKYCLEHFPSSFVLSNCAVHPEMLSFIESSSLDAIRNGQWLDWNLLLPASCLEEDRCILFSLTSTLKHCCITEPSKELDSLKGKETDGNVSGLVIRWRWIFSSQLIRKFYTFFRDWGMKEARSLLKKENLLGYDELLQSNTEIQQTKKKKKGKAKKESTVYRINREALDSKAMTFSLEKCLDALRQFSELEELLEFDALGNTSEEELLRILVEEVFSTAWEEIQTDVIREAREQLVLETKMKDEKLRSNLEKLLQRLYFYSVSLKRFADQLVAQLESDVIKQIDNYICRTLGTEILESVVTYLSFTLGLRSDGDVIPSKEWKNSVEQLPPYIQESIKTLQAFCRNESKQTNSESCLVAAFLQEYFDKFKNSEVPVVRGLSSQEVEHFRQVELEEMKTALQMAVTAPDVLTKCLKILLAEYFDVFLIFPGKSIPKLIKIVQDRLQSSSCSEVRGVLLQLHEIAVDSLQSQTVKNTQEKQAHDDIDLENAALVIQRIKDLLLSGSEDCTSAASKEDAK